MKRKQITAMITTMTMVLGITACGAGNVSAEQENTEIESILNISNNDEITWSYDSQSDSWTMSVTCAVANPELPDYQGVSVNVPGAYVKGIDTDGDGTEDVTGKTYSEEVNGQLVIDDSAKITNANGPAMRHMDISMWHVETVANRVRQRMRMGRNIILVMHRSVW